MMGDSKAPCTERNHMINYATKFYFRDKSAFLNCFSVRLLLVRNNPLGNRIPMHILVFGISSNSNILWIPVSITFSSFMDT